MTRPDETGDADDLKIPRETAAPLHEILQRPRTRRSFLHGAVGVAAALGLPGARSAIARRRNEAVRPQKPLGFEEIPNVLAADHAVAPGYSADVLIRWGDAVLGDADAFDPEALDADAQARQFGYNNDYVGYLPLPFGSNDSEHGLLCVNHEYTCAQLMWPDTKNSTELDAEKCRYEQAAHGHSVLEVRKQDGKWRVVPGAFARRITVETPMQLRGPAAGHARLQTRADPSGTRVLGTLQNCAGGVTPWGTVLIAEENFHQYWTGDPDESSESRNLARLGFGKPRYNWGRHDPRFDLEREPHEPNRFGWMVELDPYDPHSTPIKRTALGRCKHEGANVWLNEDGRVVVYTGDDQVFEYLYKFVSTQRYDANDRARNRHILDHGTLFVARFEDDGTLRWIPLVWGTGPLTPANDFASQADVLIETRRAADLVGATPLDRPEDVEPNPRNGCVYVMLTNNSERTAEQCDAANPRADNRHGHVLELLPPGSGADRNHAALSFRWRVLLRAGNPADRTHGAEYHPATSEHGWLSCPDNCAFDSEGRLWISTDQGSAQARHGIPDGMRACVVDGPERALTKLFYACPRGAEMCGPCFTPDGRTLFVAVQHPGEEKGSSFEKPSTRWPDFTKGMPPRPSVVAITKDDGGRIGDA